MSEITSDTGAIIQTAALDLTPAEIVERLDRHIVGQNEAKRSLAIALRNRWRQSKLSLEVRGDIVPKNILMIGPTGVGKTELARRLARLVKAPFVKVEASRFTEVGYQGRDVESMVRSLVKAAVSQVEKRESIKLRKQAKERAEGRILDSLVPSTALGENETAARRREHLKEKLKTGELDSQMVQLDVSSNTDPMLNIFSSVGGEELGNEMRDAMSRMMPPRRQNQTMTVNRARNVLEAEEIQDLIDNDKIAQEAIELAETQGIVFIDEVDKITGGNNPSGPDISREGVQRDLLPLVEGSSVATRWGVVRTDNMLFVAAGAFHNSSPSDLIPELQGRFPIRVTLDSLGAEEYLRILTEPENSLVKQYKALFQTEGVALEITSEALVRIADVSHRANKMTHDIGARRLHTVMEKLLEQISFDAPALKGQEVKVDWVMVESRIEAIFANKEQIKTEL